MTESQSSPPDFVKTPFGLMPVTDEMRENTAFINGLMDCLVRHRGFANIPPEKVSAEYQLEINPIFDTPRMYGVGFPYGCGLSGDTIRTLQRDVLTPFPAWSLSVAPNGMTVRQDQVITPEGTVVADLDQYMSEVAAREMERWAAGDGVKYQHAVWISPFLPAFVSRLAAGELFVVAGIFEGAPRRKKHFAIWLLAPTVDDMAVDVKNVEVMSGSFPLPVSSNGKPSLHRHEVVNGQRERIRMPYQLSFFYVPTTYTGDTIDVVNRTTKRRTTLPFDRSTVVRSADLPPATRVNPYASGS